MARISVSTHIDAPPRRVWRELEDIESHVTWMADAERLRFRTERQRGTGTVFECETRVGPLRLLDVMEITEWRPRRSMGVRHTGAVSGTGRFTLRRRRGGTTLVWRERLRFPWWLGGPLGASVATVIFRYLWRGNLGRLKQRVEGTAGR